MKLYLGQLWLMCAEVPICLLHIHGGVLDKMVRTLKDERRVVVAEIVVNVRLVIRVYE